MRNQARWLWVVGGLAVIGALVFALRPRPVPASESGYLVALLIAANCYDCGPVSAVLERLDSVFCRSLEDARATAQTWASSLTHEDAFVLVLGPNDALIAAWTTMPATEKTGSDLQRSVSDLERDLNMTITRDWIVALPTPPQLPLFPMAPEVAA